MKKLILIVVLATCVSAGDTSMQRTGGKLNGRWWHIMDNDQRFAYVLGYGDAAQMMTNWPNYFPVLPTTFEDVIKGVNRIYEEPENLVLPISDAIWLFTLKAKGYSKQRVDEGLQMVLERTRGKIQQTPPSWNIKTPLEQ